MSSSPQSSLGAAVAAIAVEQVPADGRFRSLATLGHGIEVDLRYAGMNNFAGRVLYRGIDCAWLRAEAAAGLEAAAAWLAAQRPGWRLRVLDALRPQRVQQAIWDDIAGTPAEAYFADPARGSIHSWGLAVDVTLLMPGGQEADMGSGFDEMHPRSHPEFDARHLALGVLTADQIGQRGWLHAAMSEGGFQGIPTEWWHFNHGRPERIRRAEPRVD
jgi:zinc D-Ala-D-Ala dipeptidase